MDSSIMQLNNYGTKNKHSSNCLCVDVPRKLSVCSDVFTCLFKNVFFATEVKYLFKNAATCWLPGSLHSYFVNIFFSGGIVSSVKKHLLYCSSKVVQQKLCKIVQSN